MAVHDDVHNKTPEMPTDVRPTEDIPYASMYDLEIKYKQAIIGSRDKLDVH